MIAAMTGLVRSFDGRSLHLDVHGIVFRLFVVPRSESAFVIGSTSTVSTYLHVREDAMELFGFVNDAECRFFEKLLSVSGVGPKLALSVMAAGSVADLEVAIERGDAAMLTKVSGVGNKTAQRIVVDLRGKLADLPTDDTALSSVIDALVGLGYSAREAREAAAATPADATSEVRLRAALRRLGTR